MIRPRLTSGLLSRKVSLTKYEMLGVRRLPTCSISPCPSWSAPSDQPASVSELGSTLSQGTASRTSLDWRDTSQWYVIWYISVPYHQELQWWCRIQTWWGWPRWWWGWRASGNPGECLSPHWRGAGHCGCPSVCRAVSWRSPPHLEKSPSRCPEFAN